MPAERVRISSQKQSCRDFGTIRASPAITDELTWPTRPQNRKTGTCCS